MVYKKNIIALFFFITCIGQFVSGQVVKLRCTEVLPDGDVLLSWNPLIIGTGFYNYTILWSSSLTGPYNDSVVITALSQDTYQHDGAGANSAPMYYYMKIKKDSGISPPSDTLRTMLLSLSTIDFEEASLAWTPLHVPLLPDMHPWYLLFREYPSGNWALTDSIQDLAINHHFWSCNPESDTVRFRIGVRDNVFGCISLSNIEGAVLQNQNNRVPPVIDSVSIDADGKAILGWQVATEPDIIGYKIFLVSSTNDSIDYVEGRFSTAYKHMESDPCSGPLRYIILTLDSCGNESPFPYDTITTLDKPHSTIFLQDVQYDPCLMTNRLLWNEYKNFNPPLGYSNIYVSVNSGPFVVLATIFPGQEEYIHENLLPNTNYSYYVRAISQDPLKSSTSCRKSITTYNSPSPLFMYTRYLSVEENERVNILFYTDTIAHVQFYRILRSSSPGGPFDEAGIIQDDGQEYIAFSDETADVTAASYYYQIEVTDSCGIASVIANISRTIYLQVEALPDLSNRLTWNAYESWSGGVLGYRIYRRLDQSSPEIIADVDSLTLEFTDVVSNLTGTISRISYLVEAYEGGSNIYGFSESSFSNEVLSEQEPKIYLPNAFAPMGLNNVFKPVNVFVGSSGYEFIIYNRWGQMVFSTNDPDAGWDGKNNGDYVQGDIYVYLVNFRNALDQPRHVKGNVLVLY